MKVHGRFEGNLRLQVPGKVVAECGLRLLLNNIKYNISDSHKRRRQVAQNNLNPWAEPSWCLISSPSFAYIWECVLPIIHKFIKSNSPKYLTLYPAFDGYLDG